MTTCTEITIPKSRCECIVLLMLYTLVVVASIVAAFELFTGFAVIAPCLWLLFVTWIVRDQYKCDGNFRKFFINRLGDVAGRRFADTSILGKVCFGYELFGYRFIQQTIDFNKIQSVEWRAGQATGMAGHDMKDWSVFLMFSREVSGNCQQGTYVVGPARKKEKTEAFGLTFIAFLRDAGAPLGQGGWKK